MLTHTKFIIGRDLHRGRWLSEGGQGLCQNLPSRYPLLGATNSTVSALRIYSDKGKAPLALSIPHTKFTASFTTSLTASKVARPLHTGLGNSSRVMKPSIKVNVIKARGYKKYENRSDSGQNAESVKRKQDKPLFFGICKPLKINHTSLRVWQQSSCYSFIKAKLDNICGSLKLAGSRFRVWLGYYFPKGVTKYSVICIQKMLDRFVQVAHAFSLSPNRI